MTPALTGSLAAIGLLSGWPQRAAITRLAVPRTPPPPEAQPPPAPRTPPASIHATPPASVRRAPPALVAGALTAILLGALAVRVPGGLALAAACWLTVCAVPLAFIDIAVSRLPDPLTAAAYAGTTLLLVLAAVTGGPGASWAALLRAVLGGLALAGFYLLLLIISPSGMSLGDVKLAASLGTLLAWFGWRVLIAGGAAGFLLGGLAGVALLVSRRASRQQLIPFGPFMIAGTLLAVLASV